MSRKLYIGARIRRIREQNRLNQSAFAEQLGLSNSYLNQLENNQRPVSAAVLVKLSECFGLDIASLAQEQGGQLARQLLTLQGDDLFKHKATRQDVMDFVDQQPVLAQQFAYLFDHYQRLNSEYEQLVTRFYGEQHATHLVPLPHEEVRDFFFRFNNYIEPLDRAAEAVSKRLELDSDNRLNALVNYLYTQFNVTVTIERAAALGNALRVFDPDAGILKIASEIEPHQKSFQIASVLALLGHRESMEALCVDGGLSEQAAKLAMAGLANYFAGALQMPYGQFLKEAEQHRYDIQQLQALFGVSLEQVCHRLSSLQRRKAEGVPFYFVRVDQAGNISKRQSATSFHFSKTGGACPLWNVHEVFSNPERIVRQVAEMPDGQRYFCIALQVHSGGGGFHSTGKRFSIGLGCELQHAKRLVYADGLDLECEHTVARIGPGCRLCSRVSCSQRAFPPAGGAIATDPNVHSYSPYPFLAKG